MSFLDPKTGAPTTASDLLQMELVAGGYVARVLAEGATSTEEVFRGALGVAGQHDSAWEPDVQIWAERFREAQGVRPQHELEAR
jgi:hypothetical protein